MARGPSQSVSAGAAQRRFATSLLEAQFGAPGPFNQARPLTDPQSQTAASLFSFNQTARIVHGVITDGTPIGNVYRVQLEKAKQPVVAIYGSRTSSAVYGARELTTLHPGTMVMCVWHDSMPYAQIITVIPPTGTAANMNQHTMIHGASRARVDAAHRRPFQMDSNGRIPAMLAGRPFDALMGGEAGWITETGVKLFIDSFMGLFGIDESCQLSFFYHDMMCRLAAYQYQLWTSVREEESLNDQDEAQDWTGYAMYPWESMGLAARSDPTQIKTPQEWQIDTPYYSKMEPRDNYLMPWHRERHFHGYLGQGGKHCVTAPPTQFTDKGDKGSNDSLDTAQGARSQYALFSGGEGSGIRDLKLPGLYDNFVTADGRWCVQSAKGCSIVKRCAITVPARRRRPEEPEGDNDKNYKASGLLGDGADHKITGDIKTNGKHTNFNRAMGVQDMHAYFFNYAGVHPFYYHAKDYYLPEESEAKWADGKSEEVPDYSKLADNMYLSPDNYKKSWLIDHRYDKQTFYTLSSGIELLDDGGVMIYDGYGACIRMTGGSIELSAPGDIWLKSGRNTNVWSGHDVILRAKNSWDVTATNGDGRLKAEKNMMALAGNGGTGGMLLESRGVGPTFDFDTLGEDSTMGGVVIRSTKSPFVTWSQSIYMRTGGADIQPGPIVLDANRGSAAVVTYASVEQHYINDSAYWHFSTTDEVVSGPSARLSASGTLLPGGIEVKGGIVADGAGIFNGQVVSTSAFAAVNAPYVGELKPADVAKIKALTEKCQKAIEKTIPQDVGQATMDTILTKEFYGDNKPGDDAVIRKAEFCLRVTDDYRTEGFTLHEDRWQQLARLTGKSSKQWEEKPVLCQGQKTYPYPGADAFQSQTFVQQNLTMFDANEGHSKDRGQPSELSDEYKTPKFGEAKSVSLNQYTVIR